MLKKCTNCIEWKSVDKFYRRKSTGYHASNCKQCISESGKQNRRVLTERSKKYRTNNRDLVRERDRLNREFNRDKFKLKNSKYHNENRREILAKKKIYRVLNSHIIASKYAEKRAWKKSATPVWSDKNAINNIYKEAARISKETGVKHHVDHIIPLNGENVRGLHVENNLRIIPFFENLKKSNNFYEELIT